MPPESNPAGATPVAGGATPPQTTPDTTPAAPSTGPDAAADTSATDAAALGDPGKRALDRMKGERDEADRRARAAEKERDELKLATASESERAVAAAKTEGRTEVLDRLHATIRRTAVREALLAAGVPAGLVADLSKADEFAALKVGDNDEIDADEVGKAVKAHKARVPDAYGAIPAAAGSADGGARGGDKVPATSLEDAVTQHYEREGQQRQQRRA